MRNDKAQTVRAAQRRLRRMKGRRVHTFEITKGFGMATVRASVCEVR